MTEYQEIIEGKEMMQQSSSEGTFIKDSRITALIKHKSLAALFLFLFSFAVFIPSLKGEFVWDDVEYIQKYPHDLKASEIPNKFFPEINKVKGVFYVRPILFTSFVIDREIWGVSSFGFHLSNVIFHSASTVLFYFFVVLALGEFKVNRKESIAFLSALLFAVYPAHVESVSFIGARGDILCSIFLFAAFIFHILSYRKLWFFMLAALCFLVSLLSKEVAVVFPVAVIGFDLIARRFWSRGNILRYAPYITLITVYLFLRGKTISIVSGVFSASAGESAGNGASQIGDFLQTLLSACLFYIKKLVFPFDTNPFIPTVPWGSYHLPASIIVILLLCAASLISIRKRENITAFGIFWIFITLAPSCYVAVFPVAVTPVAERFLYVPSAGYCMLAGYLILRASEKIKLREAGWIFGFLLCALYLLVTINGQAIWKSNLSLWEEASKEVPYNAYTHANYGAALLIAGETNRAIQELSIALKPGIKGGKDIRAYAANNLGVLYMNEKKDLENAEKWFDNAISYDPGFYRAYYHLGIIYFIKGKSINSITYYKKAEKYLNKTLEIYPPYGRASLFLAKIYLELGEMEKAKRFAKEALRKGLIAPLDREAEHILKAGN